MSPHNTTRCQTEDSPLSITASIAGILTFIAAICTFVYVRYNTLRNGLTEMNTVFESVVATIEETHAVKARSATAERFGADPYSSRLKKLVEDLWSTELSILAQFMNVYGTDMKTFQPSLTSESLMTMWEDVAREVEKAQRRLQPQSRWSGFRAMKSLLETMDVIIGHSRRTQMLVWSIGFVLHLGASPTVMRWYSVRKKVLEKIQRREIIRSRLLFHQIADANLRATKQEFLVRDLVERIEGLTRQLRLLNDRAKDTNVPVERLRHDDEYKKRHVSHEGSPPDQHGTAEKPASASTSEDKESD